MRNVGELTVCLIGPSGISFHIYPLSSFVPGARPFRWEDNRVLLFALLLEKN